MSKNLIPSIEILPVEIFYRIFDNLDAQTILLSIRLVCRLFRSIVTLISLRQFIRLHSINFLGIDEFQLNIILKRIIHLNFLTSFSLNIQKYDDRRRKTTLKFLSSIMTQSNL
jgi:hypothetical protein